MIKAEKQKALVGLVGGLFLTLVGAIVIVLGVTGSVDWNFGFGGISSKLTTASPGVLLAIIGFLIIVVTRFDVTVAEEKARAKAKKTQR